MGFFILGPYPVVLKAHSGYAFRNQEPVITSGIAPRIIHGAGSQPNTRPILYLLSLQPPVPSPSPHVQILHALLSSLHTLSDSCQDTNLCIELHLEVKSEKESQDLKELV